MTHKEYWVKLKKLSGENKVIDFFRLYAEYLECMNIISPSRRILYKMVKKIEDIYGSQK